ncbi:MAG: HAMP domain-containing histidine kinase [Candidatus Omnitrophica bacterium]|nr:HAMP domain-containing histidine kinase [Candidatus Omnitrophota bacterium]
MEKTFAHRSIQRIKTRRKLFGLFLRYLVLQRGVEHCAVVSRDSKGSFRLFMQRGYTLADEVELALDGRNLLVRFLEQEKTFLHPGQIKEDSNIFPSAENTLKYPAGALSKEMGRLKASYAIPYFREPVGLTEILFLGNRRNGEIVSEEEAVGLCELFEESRHVDSQEMFQEVNQAERSISETLEQKMATLGRLASSVGHEINNPLSILSMNISRVLLQYRKNPNVKVSDILDVMDHSEATIRRIQTMVRTLTGLLRQYESANMKPILLKDVLELTLPLVRLQIHMDHLCESDIDLEFEPFLPRVHGNPELLQAVFLNLFINSLHAMGGKVDGKITVKAGVSQGASRHIVIYFSDNGTGMTPEILNQIFAFRFTTKPRGKGSGIGLYLCKHILELHGGSITVGSKPGEGTTFQILLPAYEQPSLNRL